MNMMKMLLKKIQRGIREKTGCMGFSKGNNQLKAPGKEADSETSQFKLLYVCK